VTGPSDGSGRLVTPGLWPRLACLLYEGVLLFGVVMAAGLVYGLLTQQRHALVGSSGLRAFLVVVLGVYFVYFWTRSGQTLAMLTWHIKLQTVSGQAVTPARALCRYALSWLWFLPALATAHLAGLKGAGPTSGALLVGALAYAALSRLHPDRQYLHDVICRTRLVTWRRSPTSAAPTAAPAP
jgi:uncharacterized RDD family membrane protein YckC